MPHIFSGALGAGELRGRIAFTLGAILVFRIGCQVPTPGVDPAEMARIVNEHAGGLLGFFNLFSGGAVERLSIFALGIQPYINASIIVQLLAYVLPSLESLRKEGGEEGRRELERYTRYGAIAIGVLQAWGVCLMLEQWNLRSHILAEPGWRFRAVAVLTLTAGSAFVMWLGQQITRRGVGNGASILIAAGIVAGLPSAALTVGQAFELDHPSPIGCVRLALLAGLSVLAVATVAAIQDAVCRVPVMHSRRIAGPGGPARGTHLPLPLNQGGVMPVIFASSVLMLPALLIHAAARASDVRTAWPALSAWLEAAGTAIERGHPLYLLLELGLIVFFAYFYAAMQYAPAEIADNLRRHGAFVRGFRPGRETAEQLSRLLTRITLAGGLLLGLIALFPHLVVLLFGGAFRSIGLGGTSLLIVVGVTLDTMRRMQAHAGASGYRTLIGRD